MTQQFKVILIAIVAGLMVLSGYFWLKNRQVGGLASANTEIKRLKHVNDSLTKAHIASQKATDTASKTVTKTIVRYDTLRKHIVLNDTSHYVLVDTQYIHVSDSVVAACTKFQTTCSQEREAAQKRINNLTDEKKALSDALKHQPGFLRRVGDFTIGGLTGFASCKAIK